LRSFVTSRCRSVCGSSNVTKRTGTCASSGNDSWHALKIVEVVELLAADTGHDAAARDRGLAEDVAGIRDVDAGDRPIEMPRLLIRELVKDAVAVLDVLVGRDVVQVADLHARLEPLPAALDDDADLAAHGTVEHRCERHELCDELAVDLDEHVAGLELARGRRLRNHLLDDEQARLLRERLAHARFRVARQSQAPQLGERLVHELGLERTARHGLPCSDVRERDLDAIERQEEARGRLRVRAGVQRDDAALDVDDRRARRAARSARRGLQIEGVEVVVVARPWPGAASNRATPRESRTAHRHRYRRRVRGRPAPLRERARARSAS
jgi:hypothetical protein